MHSTIGDNMNLAKLLKDKRKELSGSIAQPGKEVLDASLSLWCTICFYAIRTKSGINRLNAYYLKSVLNSVV